MQRLKRYVGPCSPFYRVNCNERINGFVCLLAVRSQFGLPQRDEIRRLWLDLRAFLTLNDEHGTMRFVTDRYPSAEIPDSPTPSNTLLLLFRKTRITKGSTGIRPIILSSKRCFEFPQHIVRIVWPSSFAS